MILPRFAAVILLLAAFTSLKAVEIVPYPSGTSYYNTNDTISSSLSGWSSGWGSGNTNDGWNYVGQVGGALATASGVYLGNGWVITAGHVGAGNITLGGNSYAQTGSIFSNFSYGGNSADITLFQISTTSGNHNLSMMPLTISSSFSNPGTNSSVVMVGYGGGNKSWGINKPTTNATYVNVLGTNNGIPYNYTTVDFQTAYGPNAPVGVTNNAQLVGGDSGGGVFATNASGSWQLTGLNEAVDPSTGSSYFVNLGWYESQIQADIASVPEPSTYCLMIFGVSAMGLTLWRVRRRG